VKKTHARVFFDFICGAFCGYTMHHTAKVSEGTNMPARNKLVQLLALYTNPETRMHSVTDGQTDGRQDYANSRSLLSSSTIG